jgi:hypothetical protein
LEQALGEVTRPEVFGDTWINGPPAGRADQQFLTADPLYRRQIAILTHFGKSGRYSNLDIITGQTEQGEDPISAWKRLEIELLDHGEMASSYPKVTARMVGSLERGFRALARWFTLGGGRLEGRQHSGLVTPFVRLMDSDIGRTEWSNNVT